jgi:methenyltetrahydrofolate cyclohydrolase
MSEEFDATTLGQLWDRVADGGGGMGAGAVAAATAATAASLVEMVSRASTDVWPEAADVAGQANALRTWAVQLVQMNMEAYATGKQALETAYSGQGDTASLRDTLGQAMEVPLRISELAAEIADLAARAAESADHDLRPDAAAAAALAAASARAAAHLVSVNLTATPDDPRVSASRAAAEDAEARSRTALGEEF